MQSSPCAATERICGRKQGTNSIWLLFAALRIVFRVNDQAGIRVSEALSSLNHCPVFGQPLLVETEESLSPLRRTDSCESEFLIHGKCGRVLREGIEADCPSSFGQTYCLDLVHRSCSDALTTEVRMDA